MTSIFALGVGLMMAADIPVTEVTIHPVAQETEIVIQVDGDPDYRDFFMEGPHRLVVDFMGAEHALPGENFMDINRGGVRAVRTSQYSSEIVRVVVELERKVSYRIEEEEGRLRLRLENPMGAFEAWSTGSALASSGSGSGPAASPAASAAAPVGASAPAPRSDRSGPSTRSRQNAVRAGILQQPGERITVSFTETPIQNVLFTFSEFSGRSIVPGSAVSGDVTADIRDQPWDVALRTILEAQGLVAQETESGIIRVDNIANLAEQEQVEPVVTRPFRVSYATAGEIQNAIEPLLSERGSISVGQGTNSVVVTDLPRIIEDIEALLEELDIRTPQVQIQAKIIFVNRTDLREMGIIWDLKDTEGNQLNSVNPGGLDTDGDGTIDMPNVEDDVVLIGGNSIAALGNANQNVSNPALQVLTSLDLGRFSLLNFVQALEELNLSEIQAAPTLSVMDNNLARVQVGQETPLRVIEAGGQAGENVIPTATVQTRETGIILEVTPHVTASDNILLELHAERSDVELASTDVGFIFNTQEADSRVLVRDGETVVIAGLTVTEETEARAGIPGLMDIPYIGGLFRLTRNQRTQEDLMILVTPHIVRDNAD
ncbi:MAG: AMIN domain-containing protein [bacterium]